MGGYWLMVILSSFEQVDWCNINYMSISFEKFQVYLTTDSKRVACKNKKTKILIQKISSYT
jgi:hypothetical protein